MTISMTITDENSNNYTGVLQVAANTAAAKALADRILAQAAALDAQAVTLQFLPDSVTPPTTRVDGSALKIGDFYGDTSTGARNLCIYTSAGWVSFVPDAAPVVVNTTAILAAAKAAADAADLVISASAKSYADAGDAAGLVKAKSYADAGDVTNLAAAKNYAVAQDASNLTTAKSYADSQDVKNLASAKTYSDGSNSTTLTSAKSYADTQDAKVLVSAKAYTDSVSKSGGTGGSTLDTTGYTLYKIFDTVALMKAGANSNFPRVRWRGYLTPGDGGGGEGVYSSVTSPAQATDEGSYFATSDGGTVARDFPAGRISTAFFGMVAGMALSGSDCRSAAVAALTYAASTGRACHINGAPKAFIYSKTFDNCGCRLVTGDGIADSNGAGTTLAFIPAVSDIVEFLSGFHITNADTEVRDIKFVSQDNRTTGGYAGIASNTLISAGVLTLPTGFVAHTDTLPITAFVPGIAALSVDSRAHLVNVQTSGGKYGAIMNSTVGHITAENCSFSGGLIGRFWLKNDQDHRIFGGGSSGAFCGEGMTENGFAGEVYAHHMFHIPYGWYQFSYWGGNMKGVFYDCSNHSIEHMTESWMYLDNTSISNTIKSSSGGDPYGYDVGATETDAYNQSTRLPDAYFANSKRNYYSCGRFGYLKYWKVNELPDFAIHATGGVGTFSHRVTAFLGDFGDSDIVTMGDLDLASVTGGSPDQSMLSIVRALRVYADRSVSGIRSRAPSIGNLAIGTSQYSAAMGLGQVNNALVANGGGWSVYAGNASYPAKVQLDTLSNWIAGKTYSDGTTRAPVPLNFSSAIGELVGLNPLVLEITNTGGNTSAYINITANNVSDGQTPVSFSVMVAGPCGVGLSASTNSLFYSRASPGALGDTNFYPIFFGGKVLAAGATVTQIGINANTVGSKVYVIAPMASFGGLQSYNPHSHPSSLDPMYLASGLRQAGRVFVTSSGSTATQVTIADFLVAIDSTAAAGTATLPATPFDGEVHIIKKIDASANAVTVNGNGPMIDGSSTYVIPASARSQVRVQYVGSAATPQWFVV